jgi:RelE toxin of RelE / RelB toxin-antitoxin system
MHIFQTKWFAHWADKEGLSPQVLCDAAAEISRGLVDANLGGYVVKTSCVCRIFKHQPIHNSAVGAWAETPEWHGFKAAELG